MTVRTRRVPWSPRSWRQALYLAGGIPAQLAAFLLVFGWEPKLWRHLIGIPLWPQHWGKPWWPAPILLVVVFFALPLLTWMHRQRLHVATGARLPPQPAWHGIAATVRSSASWRQLGYHLVAAPALAFAAILAVSCWLTGLACALVYCFSWDLGHGNSLYQGIGAPVTMARSLHVPLDAYVTVAGFALLAVAPFLTAAVVTLDTRIARVTLGTSRAEELELRVEQLAQTRAGVVDAADTERRRLERDLHDGTQQRLVSLAMNLGMAKADTTTFEQAHRAIADAHEEAKAALTELRNLVRGLHPPVLEDRGLDAALSGIAARMPIPVRLTVDVPRRPPAVVEAVAYFVVSEGLTNITKHAQASQAEVVVHRAGDRLHIIISDDGVGGADPADGSGLAGLAKRAASVDGTFEVTSPQGGPTLLTADLPCAR